jgi:hypothetical protein
MRVFHKKTSLRGCLIIKVFKGRRRELSTISTVFTTPPGPPSYYYEIFKKLEKPRRKDPILKP